MLMLKPDQSPEGAPEETEGVPEDGGPSFEDLLMLVFSGPMCFECLDEMQGEEVKSKGMEKESGEQS